jgi:hypothetical protein
MKLLLTRMCRVGRRWALHCLCRWRRSQEVSACRERSCCSCKCQHHTPTVQRREQHLVCSGCYPHCSNTHRSCVDQVQHHHKLRHLKCTTCCYHIHAATFATVTLGTMVSHNWHAAGAANSVEKCSTLRQRVFSACMHKSHAILVGKPIAAQLCQAVAGNLQCNCHCLLDLHTRGGCKHKHSSMH